MMNHGNEFSLQRGIVTLATVIVLASPAATLASAGHDESNGKDSYAFGQPVSASDADRTMTIVARDAMTFSPSSIEVREGETVRFVVKNVGKLQHSFTIGTPEIQREHEEEMEGMPMGKMAEHMKDDPTGIVVAPGESRTLTWRFSRNVPVEIACHIPGHYAAGMKGNIEVR